MEFDYSLEPGKIRTGRYLDPEGKPLVSIITPYYNGGERFEQTFNSVLNQTFAWFEWIIVNDGSSSEEDVGLIESLAVQDRRVRVIHQENTGAAGARKRGIQESTTELIIFLDADDLIEKPYVEYLYWVMQNNPTASWAYTDSLGFGEAEYLWKREFRSETMKKENILSYIAAIRKSVFEENDFYDDQSANLWEDYQFWLKILAKGYKPAHIEQVMFWYRRSSEGELSKIEKNPELKRSLSKRIQKLASNVPNSIRAVTFNGSRQKEFEKPHKWSWDRKLPFAQGKIRLLMLLPHLACGGADKFNLDVLKNIDRDKYEIGIVTTVPAQNEWHQLFCQYTDDVFILPNFLDMNDWSSFIHYYIYSRDVKIVWNISSYYGYYLLPWLRAEFPETAILDCIHAEGRYWRAGGYPRLSAAMDSVLEKTFVTNAFTRDILVTTYGKDSAKMQVVYTGIDETVLDREQVSCEGLKERLGIAANRPSVLFLCRVAAEKRPFLMLEIAKAVRERIPEICFLSVGTGPQIEELRAKIKAEKLEKTVYVLGGQDDIKPFYKLCDLFLLCSIKEGLSITTMEAMAMEMPVVSADVGSQYELVGPDTGRLITCRQDEADDFDSRTFPKGEIHDYVEAICALLSDKETLHQMGKACRSRILDGFTLSSLITTLDQEFDRLLQPEAMEKRREIAENLKLFSEIAEDYLTTYIEFETKERDLAEVWRKKERRHPQNESREELSTQDTSQSPAENEVNTPEVSLTPSEAELILKDIYSMRSWKLIKRYQNFMDHTYIGRILRRIRDVYLNS